MKSLKRSTDNSLFFAAWGAVTLLFQIPLVTMILEDPESLSLGSWDWPTFSLFCFLTFVAVPLTVALFFRAVAAISSRLSSLLFAVTASFFFSMQFSFHILQFYFQEAEWRRSALIGIFLVLAAALVLLRKALTPILKGCAAVSLAVFALFAFQAFPYGTGDSYRLESLPVRSEGKAPVFFFTFEKICDSYVTEGQGKILDRLPNLARLVSEADYYPQTYANCTATVYSLKTLYCGRLQGSNRNWKQNPNLRDIVGAKSRVFMVLDILTDYCNPRRHVLLRAIGKSRRGLDIIAGWYKTYALPVIPDPLEVRLALLGWHFDPRYDMWMQENAHLKPGEQMQYVSGTRQFETLKEVVKKEGVAPNLYIMHNWITDGPEVKSSGFTNHSPEQYAKELEGARQNLTVFDRELGSFLEFLKKEGIYDRALIVVTADTGYDHEARNIKGEAEIPAPKDLVRVFFVLKRPGQKEGRVFQSVLRQIDVLPTLLTDLGIDPKPYRFEGTPVTDPQQAWTLAQRPLDFLFTSEGAAVLHYRLTQPGGPFRKVR